MIVQVLNIRDIKDAALENAKLKSIDEPVCIYRQKTGFGYRRFFICPHCGERREKLYIFNTEKVFCRTCSPKGPYEGITHVTRGGTDEIEYRMSRLAAIHHIKLEYPFSCYKVYSSRPKYMRHDKWREGLYKLQVLENMRNQTIFFNKKYSAKLIKYILENCLYKYSLQDLEQYFIDWGKCIAQI